MLNIGEFGPNWYNDVYPVLKDNPPLLLHSYDFELLDPNSVAQEIEDLANPDNYRKINKEFKFIPFGQSYGGDHYCFFLNEEKNGEIPIVFVSHDSNEADYLAKNLQDFIFKMFLTDMSYFDNEDMSDEDVRNNLEDMFRTHKKYLADQQKDILKDIFSREIIDYQVLFPNYREDARGLLTDIEKNKLINEIIFFDKMDTSFEYSNE